MILVSITPGDPCRVRAYACSLGSRLRSRRIDVKFNITPTRGEVEQLRVNPEAFVAAVSEPAVA